MFIAEKDLFFFFITDVIANNNNLSIRSHATLSRMVRSSLCDSLEFIVPVTPYI